MLKLYKQTDDEIRYWEAWDTGNGSVMIHWGVLGDTGRSKELGVENASAAVVIERESVAARADGFQEIDMDDHSQVIVQFKTKDAWGDTDDLDRRYELEDLLNECLGWTGNGHCDGGDIGSGTINAYSFVVDPRIAAETIVQTLKDAGKIKGAIVVISTEEDDDVVWPPGFEGEFSII